jgi:hypothetical protein
MVYLRESAKSAEVPFPPSAFALPITHHLSSPQSELNHFAGARSLPIARWYLATAET